MNTSRQQARQAARDTQGRYASMPRAVSPVSLSGPQPTWEQRREQLLADGYVPAIGHMSGTVRETREDKIRNRWWSEHWVSGEYRHKQGDVPKMNDDNTPLFYSGKPLDGASLQGNRRVPRVLYTGEDFGLRMPSKTAILRYAKQTGHHIFDVPVTLTRPDGKVVSGWVRMSGKNGVWDAEALGFTHPSDAVLIGDGITTLMEARRPTMALHDAREVLRSSVERASQRGTDVEPVGSEWVAGFGYDQGLGVMTMKTRDGRTYARRVPLTDFRDFKLRGGSPGAFWNATRGMRGFRATECPDCRRVYMKGPHLCRAGQDRGRQPLDHFNQVAVDRASRVMRAAKPSPDA